MGLAKVASGKNQLVSASNVVRGKKKVIFDLSSPEQFLNQVEQLPLNPKFDSKSRMPVEEVSSEKSKNRLGIDRDKLSDTSKLDSVLKEVTDKSMLFISFSIKL